MNKIETGFPGLYVIEPQVFGDDRGYFFESFHTQKLEDLGIPTQFVQDNESKSKYGVVRGLHYQLGEWAQSKLVRVFTGAVLDVAVDLRKDSPTYGKHFSVVLSGENKKQLLIPRGFAHGFAVLSEDAVFFYKCDNFYSKDHEVGMKFDDPALGIDWQLPAADILLSERDQQQPSFENATFDFTL